MADSKRTPLAIEGRYARRRKPCVRCGGVKEPGTARRYCDACTVTRNREGRYGLEPGAIARRIEAQGGRCAACSRPTAEWHIDHDHARCTGGKTCGRCIRDLLCRGCNHALGNIEDDPDRALALAAYLIRHRDVHANTADPVRRL